MMHCVDRVSGTSDIVVAEHSLRSLEDLDVLCVPRHFVSLGKRALDLFPIALFPTAFDTANRLFSEPVEIGPVNGIVDHRLLYLTVLCTVINLNSGSPLLKGFDKACIVSFEDRPVMKFAEHLIDPFVEAHIADPQRILVLDQVSWDPERCTRPQFADELEVLEAELSDLVVQTTKRGIQGHPALIFPAMSEGESLSKRRMADAIFSACNLSPYCVDPGLNGKESGRMRFDFISLLHKVRTDPDDIDELAALVRKSPWSVAFAGWCGGRVIHEAAQEGSLPLAELCIGLVETGRVRDIKARRTVELPEYLEYENRDGCTPLLLALTHQHQNVAELLCEKGASLQHANRFGERPEDFVPGATE